MFVVFVLVVVGFLYAISEKKYPQMPADANHLGMTEIAVCLECQGIFPDQPTDVLQGLWVKEVSRIMVEELTLATRILFQ